MAWKCAKTRDGLALEAKTIAGATITLTRCVSGSKKVPTAYLQRQTAITEEKQTLSIQNIKVDGNKYAIRTMLTNVTLNTGYDLHQIGFYANDPDKGEILFAIAQIDNAKPIPDRLDSPGYAIEFTFTFENSADANINIALDTSGIAMLSTVHELIDGVNKKIDDITKDLDTTVELDSDITD